MMAAELSRRDLAHAAAARDFYVFFELAFYVLEPGKSLDREWFLDAMAHVLAETERGAIKRLMITIPPRHMKTIMSSIVFPAWVLGRNPKAKIICASYSQELSLRFSRTFRSLVQSDLYRSIFPATTFTRMTESECATSAGGFRYATSVGGAATGIGCDYVIIDDLMKAAEASYPEARQRAKDFADATLLSRLEQKADGRVISIQQRLHDDDIVAHLKAKQIYHCLELPAEAVKDELIPLTYGRVHTRRIGDLLNPARENRETLSNLRRDMGNRTYEAQYQQNPSPADSQYIDWRKIQFYDEAPPRNRLLKVVHSWDTASSTAPNADYSVGTVWGYDGSSWLLIDLIRTRLVFPDLLARARSERNRWRADVILVEDASSGIALLEELRRDSRQTGADRSTFAPYSTAFRTSPKGTKADRMFAQVQRLYTGEAKFPRDAPFMDELRNELLKFPDGTYDDQVDSISQFLRYSVGPGGRSLLDGDKRPDPPRPQGFPRRP